MLYLFCKFESYVVNSGLSVFEVYAGWDIISWVVLLFKVTKF